MRTRSCSAELDTIADGCLWDDHYPWPVPNLWLQDGTIRIRPRVRRAADAIVERPIPPPLRRWATARITTAVPHRSMDALQRLTTIPDARGCDAVMSGLLDACRAWPDDARAAIIEGGCSWSNGSVRLAALQLLAETDPEDAVRRAQADPNAKVRDRAARLHQSAMKPTPTSQQPLFA